MRIVEVIGTVTLSRMHPSVAGLRWLVGVPFSLKGLAQDRPDGEDLVISDDLGAGVGSRIGISQGGEAAVPFLPKKKPIDAYCALILDSVTITENISPKR